MIFIRLSFIIAIQTITLRIRTVATTVFTKKQLSLYDNSISSVLVVVQSSSYYLFYMMPAVAMVAIGRARGTLVQVVSELQLRRSDFHVGTESQIEDLGLNLLRNWLSKVVEYRQPYSRSLMAVIGYHMLLDYSLYSYSYSYLYIIVSFEILIVFEINEQRTFLVFLV